MSLVAVGTVKDNRGIVCDIMCDTDDLANAEYHYYNKATRLIEKDERARLVARQILMGELTAEMIESDDKYKFITDDSIYNALLADSK